LKLPATNQSPQTQRVRRKRDGSEPDVVEEPKVPESQWRSADHADFKLPDGMIAGFFNFYLLTHLIV
jgi:hypothetical protein